MLPRPRFTLFVARSILPISKATLLASSGWLMSAPVEISISGTPRRSSRNVTVFLPSPVFRPESSSRVICWIGMSFSSTLSVPDMEIIAVR